MQITQTPVLLGEPELSKRVSEATALLESTVGSKVAGASAQWDLARDDFGRSLLVLRLRDLFGQSEGEFAPDEVSHVDHMAFRLNDLLGALHTVARWKSDLRELYDRIREWCRDLPALYIAEDPVILREMRSGSYEVTRLRINSSGRAMTVEPVGAWIVGCDGRVDLDGPAVHLRLLFHRDRGWSWVDNTLPFTLRPLTRELFLRLAEACLNG